MTLEQEITTLTAKWYKYVGFDHHKDRDCHWYIQKVWSYGEEPYYYAYHEGYVSERWQSPKCDTEELAQTLLRNHLAKLLSQEVERLRGLDQDELDWQSLTAEQRDKLVMELV